MRVTLSRSGGFAGILPPPISLDTSALPSALAGRLEGLVAAVDFFRLPRTVAPSTRQPDRLQFSVCVANDDGREHTVTCDEEIAPAGFLELVRAIQRMHTGH
jgi:hypothetical protein